MLVKQRDDSVPLGKAYMTTPDYVYFGTLLSQQSVESVTRGTEPRTQNRGVSEQKTTRELKVIAKLKQAARGPDREQFSELRMADALAVCNRNWSHFADSGGVLQPHQLWLPSQLARQMRSDGRRLPSGCLQSLQSADPAPLLAERSAAAALLDDVVEHVPKVQQTAHTGRAVYGFAAGVPLMRTGERGLTAERFKTRPVTPGSFVVTRPAPSGPWAKSKPELTKLDFWMWRVQRIIQPGNTVPGFRRPASTHIYEAHLYQPRSKKVKGKWVPLYLGDRPAFMRTPAEKARRCKRRLRGSTKAIKNHDDGDDDAEAGGFLKPVRCYLRPDNIIGGGFGRTGAGSVPEVVQRYALRVVA